MTFKFGESGNPTGRPKGAISKRTQIAKLLEPHAEELIAKAVELAKSGDINALRLCLERLLPKLRDEPIAFELPDGDLSSTYTFLQLSANVIERVALGEITPEQGQRLSSLIDAQCQLVQTTTMAAQLEEIHAIVKARKQNNKR